MPRILIVEDKDSLRTMLEEMLKAGELPCLVATSSLGRSELTAPILIRKAAAPGG